jgi:hypothetical protein
MNPNDRVLGADGLFYPFPKRHIEKAIEHGTREAVDPGEPEHLLESAGKGKAQLMKEAYEREKSQAAIVRLIQETEAKKIAEEKAYEEAKANPVIVKDPPQYADTKEFEEPLLGHGKNGKAEMAKNSLHGSKAQDAIELVKAQAASKKAALEAKEDHGKLKLEEEKAKLEAIEAHKAKHRANR